MNQNVHRIHHMVGRLSAATWARIEADPTGWFEILHEDSPPCGPPVTAEEISAWNKLTAPENEADFAEYQKYWSAVGISDFAKQLHEAIRNEIKHRKEEEADLESSGP